MTGWQFNVLFCVGVGGAVLLLIAPAIGLEAIPDSPTAVTGVGTILAYVLTQKGHLTRHDRTDGSDDDKGGH